MPLLTFFSGFALGINAGRSWLGLLGALTGFVLAAVFWMARSPVKRRREMRALRPKAEAMLDAMIALAEHPPRPLEQTAVFNAEVPDEADAAGYHLQLRAEDGAIRHLEVSALRSGRRAGWIRLQLSVRSEGREIERCDYLGLVEYAPPEDWLIGRIAKLRGLVGDVSLYKAWKRRLRAAGIDIDKEAACGVDPFDPPPDDGINEVS